MFNCMFNMFGCFVVSLCMCVVVVGVNVSFCQGKFFGLNVFECNFIELFCVLNYQDIIVC